MIELIETNRDYGKWVHDNNVDYQMREVMNWMNTEDYGEINGLDLNEVIGLFCFLHFVIGVEYMADLYEQIDEERADRDHTTERLCREFNGQIGSKIIDY